MRRGTLLPGRQPSRTAFLRSFWLPQGLCALTRPWLHTSEEEARALGTAHAADVWRHALLKRTMQPARKQKKYRELVLADRARARWRFGVDKRHAPGEAVDNEDPPAHSKLAVDFDQWCRSNSWAMCSACSSMVPRELTERALSHVLPAIVNQSSCPRCRAKVDVQRSCPGRGACALTRPF